MAELVLSQVGTFVGSEIGWNLAAVSDISTQTLGMLESVGGGIGSYVGAAIDRALFAADQKNIQGPRLSDLNTQLSNEGGIVNIIYGTVRIAGTVIWTTGLQEVATTSGGGGGGGSGGGGGGGSYTSYTYYTDVAVSLCEGEITGIRRIWADTKLIYDVSENSSTGSLVASSSRAKSIRIYSGTETQEKDPLIQAIEGDDNTPAYRGTAYIVFEDLALADFGNRIPNFTFEVVSSTPEDFSVLDDYTFSLDPYEYVVKCQAGSDGVVRLVTVKNRSHLGGLIYGGEVRWWYLLNGQRIFVRSIILYTYSFILAGPFKFTRSADIDDESIVVIDAYTIGRPIYLEVLGNDIRAYALRNLEDSAAMAGRIYITKDYIYLADQYYAVCAYKLDDVYAYPLPSYAGSIGAGYYYGTPNMCVPKYRLRIPNGVSAYASCAEDDNYLYVGTYDYSNNSFIHRLDKAELENLSGDIASTNLNWDTYSYQYNPGSTYKSRGTVEVIDGVILHFANNITIYKSETWPIFTLLGTIPVANNPVASDGEYSIGKFGYLYHVCGRDKSLWCSDDLLSISTMSLSAVVADICNRVDLQASQYDISTLSSDNVNGYAVTSATAARAVLEPLTITYSFEIAEIDGKIKSIKLKDNINVGNLSMNNLGGEVYE